MNTCSCVNPRPWPTLDVGNPKRCYTCKRPLKSVKTMTRHTDWEKGYIEAEDTHCFIICKCGEQFSASDYKMTECPNCHAEYITVFICYRISEVE